MGEEALRNHEWESEPNEKFFEANGLSCVILRHPRLKHLCGYVGLPKDHKHHGKNYDDIPVEVHGGLTFADSSMRQAGDNEEWVKTDKWWVGFDCAHLGDLSPGVSYRVSSEVYKNMFYTENECRKLAEQLSGCSPKGGHTDKT